MKTLPYGFLFNLNSFTILLTIGNPEVVKNQSENTALVVAGSKIKYISSKNLMDKQNVSGIKTETWLNKVR